MTESRLKMAMQEVGALVASIGLLCQIGALIRQSYLYLKNGAWIPMPALEYLGRWAKDPWLSEPNTWLGVHKILNSLNLGTALMLMSFVAGAVIALSAPKK